MLRRLMKYEFLSTGRIFGLCYIGVLLAAVLVRILSEFAYNQSETMRELLPLPMADIFAALSAFLYFGMIVAVIVVTLILILQRFYKNLLCGEGYLMHTLPVNAHQLICSKLTAAVVWTVASTVVVMLSIVLLVATPGSMFDFLFAFGDFLQRFQQEAHFSFLVLCLEFFVVLVVAVAASILQIYAAIMLGHQAPKHRILLAVVAYFAIHRAQRCVGWIGGLDGRAGAGAGDAAGNAVYAGKQSGVSCSFLFHDRVPDAQTFESGVMSHGRRAAKPAPGGLAGVVGTAPR